VVLLAVPLGVIGAVLATTLRALNNDVFFQIGLSARNAILIVEFAKESYGRGVGLVAATLDSAHQDCGPS
jgi:multidrug efflux pump